MIRRTVRCCPHGRRHRHHHDRCRVNEHLPSDDEDENHVHGVDDTSDSESGNNTMRCLSCKEEYSAQDAGTCKECYEEAGETEEELRREIGELKSKIAFLSFLDQDRLPSQSTRGGFRGDGGSDGCYRAVAYADVVLVASDEGEDSVPVQAHRAVLATVDCGDKPPDKHAKPFFRQACRLRILLMASRSPVFKAMLENEMEESRSGTIRISEASTEALNAFVSYLYTSEASLDEQMACELLVLAEKYQVKHLKSYCEKFLISKLNWDNSVVNYSFAHQHNAKLLVDAALCLITDNMDKLTKQAEYRQLVEKDARLVVDIYEAYLSKQVNTAAPKDKR